VSPWVEVAEAAACPPGKMLRVRIDQRRILIANVAGVYYALDDTCTHEDASLVTGCLHETWVKCPLHGSRFDLKTGVPLEDPATEALCTYAVRVEAGRIALNLSL